MEAFLASAAIVGLAEMLANVPAVMIGSRAADRLPLRAIRLAAAAVFLVLGVLTLLG